MFFFDTLQAFSTDRANKLTIETLDPLQQYIIGQRIGLSFFDVKLANLAYCEGDIYVHCYVYRIAAFSHYL